MACSAVIIASFSSMLAWGEHGSFDYDSRRIQIGETTFFMITAVNGIQTGNLTGFYNMSENFLYDVFEKDDSHNFDYYDSTNDDDLQVGFTTDLYWWNYTDVAGATIFERWGWYSTNYRYIPLESIKAGQLPTYNVSAVSFEIHSKKYDLVVITESDQYNHSDLIDEYDFWVGISYDPYDEANMAKTSLFGIISQIMTCRIPNVHPLIQLFIIVPIWAGVSFMLFTLISRMIPFISGG